MKRLFALVHGRKQVIAATALLALSIVIFAIGWRGGFFAGPILLALVALALLLRSAVQALRQRHAERLRGDRAGHIGPPGLRRVHPAIPPTLPHKPAARDHGRTHQGS